MNSKLIKDALKIQTSNYMDISKNEKEYAFTFIYPPTEVLYPLVESPIEGKRISVANLYIHIPYCTGRCSYCYFGCYSLATAPVEKSVYVQKICEEMELFYEKFGQIELQSIHFGGGTPTTLSCKDIDCIFSSIRKNFKLPKGIEITFESSPETLTSEKLVRLVDNGVNRINIGIQTLNDEILHSLQRRHNSWDALNAINLAKKNGIENINVDLMYGLQGQTMDDWISTLNTIFKYEVQSISTYRLRIHPKGKITNQLDDFDENEAIVMYVKMVEMMQTHSYFQCSSHKFAIKKGLAQKQIVNKRGIDNNTLIPIGMAAYGYIDDTLYWNERKMEQYIKKVDNKVIPYSVGYHLDESEKKAKSCVLGIHNINGIDIKKYERVFNEKIQDTYDVLLKRLDRAGLINITEENIKLSELGMIFADEIATKFYSDSIKEKLVSKKKKYGIFFEHILD